MYKRQVFRCILGQDNIQCAVRIQLEVGAVVDAVTVDGIVNEEIILSVGGHGPEAALQRGRKGCLLYTSHRQASCTDCSHCGRRKTCFETKSTRRRVLASGCYPAFFRGHSRIGTPAYLSMMRLRKIWAEGSFSVLKREHCLPKIRKRGIPAVNEECLLSVMALNLKRMVKASFFAFSAFDMSC